MRVYNLKVNDKDFEISIKSMDLSQVKVEVNGKEHTVLIGGIKNLVTDRPSSMNSVRPQAPAQAPLHRPVASAATAGGAGEVRAPIPGQVKVLFKKVGDSVQASDKILMMEAMKMENDIEAGVAGVIKEIRVQTGESVAQDQVMVVIG